MMRSYFWFVTSRPIPALLIAGIVALVLALFMLRLTRDVSPDAFIPPNHPALIRKQQVEESFGLREPIAIGVFRDEPGGIFNPDTLRLIQHLTQAIQQVPGIDPDDVLSIATESGVYFEDGEPGYDRLLRSIPEDAEGLEALKEDILGYELYVGTLLAEDCSAACIVIRPPTGKKADELYRHLKGVLRDPVVTRQIKNNEHLVVAGEAAVRAHMGVAVSDDALRMNFICPVVMALLIVLAYRTVRGTVLPLCVIGGASAMAMGLMAAFGVPIYIVTNGIFVIIMALGVADSVHLLGQYYEEQLDLGGRNRQEVVVDACMALWYPLLVTTLTDFAGFFALFLVGKMPPIRFFGLFTCVGVLGALLYSYVVVPAGLMMVKLEMSGAFLGRRGRSGHAGNSNKTSRGRNGIPIHREPARTSERHGHPELSSPPTRGGVTMGSTPALNIIGAIMGTLGALVFRRRWAVAAIGVALISLASWGASKVVVNDARILAFKDHHPIVHATRALNSRFDGTSHLNVVVEASRKRALLEPEILQKIEDLERFTETLPNVGGTHSLAGWVKRAHQKMNEDDPDYYAIPEDPFDTQYYLDVLSDERTSPMAHLLSEVVDKTYTRANLIVRMTSSQFIHQRAVVQALDRYFAEEFNDEVLGAKLAGRVDLDYHWLKLIRSTHFNSVGLSVACVLIMTGLMFRSIVAGVLCTLTVGMAVLVNYAIMGLEDIPLGVGTAMFASIAIGAGINFPIHILDRLRIGLRDPEANPSDVFSNTLAFTGRALFYTAFVVAVGFLLLCVSEFRTLVHFGLLIGVGMIVSFLTSVTLLPAAVALLRPRFVWPNREPARTA
ncbi:MAG: efflux RND transporter permease subunit [Planctomycetota bacterium]|jgi:predicted RND superfamily exporter protein